MIQHVALEVRPGDAPACVRFWTLLGFEPVPPPGALGESEAGPASGGHMAASGTRTVWMQRGPTQVHLLFADEPVAAPEGHVAVVVSDYDAVLEALRGTGLRPEPRTEHWGSPRSFVRCPAGHRVELMAQAPPGMGSAPP